MGLITHPHTSHNQSNWGITILYWIFWDYIFLLPFLKVTIFRIEVSPDIQRSSVFLWVPHISSNYKPIPTRENLQKEIHKQSILLYNHGSFETSIEGQPTSKNSSTIFITRSISLKENIKHRQDCCSTVLINGPSELL